MNTDQPSTPTESAPAPCSALLEAFDFHQDHAESRLRFATNQRKNIAAMDADPTTRPDWATPWEETKAHNLRQADFDESWAAKHLRWADALRRVVSPAFDGNRQAEIARLTAALAAENARCRALEAAIIKRVDMWRRDALTNEECARKPDGLAYRGRADAFRSCAREMESALTGAQNSDLFTA